MKKIDPSKGCPYKEAMQRTMVESVQRGYSLKSFGEQLRVAFRELPKTGVYAYYKLGEVQGVIPITTHRLHRTDDPYKRVRDQDLVDTVIENIGLALDLAVQKKFITEAMAAMGKKIPRIAQEYPPEKLAAELSKNDFIVDIVFDPMIDAMRAATEKRGVV